MKADDIDLSAMLDFQPERGQLLLNRQRMLIFSQKALGRLDELLAEHLGQEFARAVFSQFGYRCGMDDYQVIGQSDAWESDQDRISSGPVMHMWEGIVHVEPTELRFDRDSGEFFMAGLWRNSFEAENHLRMFGPSDEPVCSSLTGYASGWATAFFGSSLLAIETACIAQGDPTCAFEIRPTESWDERADPWRAALDATSDSIASVLEQRVAERTIALEAANRDLEQAREAAEDANRAKSQFLANISHDLRTPMNGVLGMAELLKATALDARQRELVDLIVESGNLQVAIITDLLDYTQLEVGSDEVRMAPFTPAQTLLKVITRYEAVARSKGVELVSEIGESCSGSFVSDADKVGRVVAGLVGNAVKFTPRGGRVVVEAGVDAGEIVITVADTGIGVPREQAEAIFAPFVQADASATRVHGGTGLGLAIARDLAHLLEGSLTLVDRPGVGATFDFRFPAQPDGSDMTASAAAGESIRVLVAEDNRVNARVIQALLESLGCEVDVVANGNDAVARSTEAFDLILLDLHMPELDGVNAVVGIRRQQGEQEPPVVIAAVTADARDEVRASCYDAGFDAFLPKPVSQGDLAELVGRVRRATDSR
ncbi:MAG: XylR N-terminal domain-containing protein [Candidatus Nanopelagicales bacterium]